MSLHMQHSNSERPLLCWRCTEHDWEQYYKFMLLRSEDSAAFNANYKWSCIYIFTFYFSAARPVWQLIILMTSILYVTVQLLAWSLSVSDLIFVNLSVIAYNVSSSAASALPQGWSKSSIHLNRDFIPFPHFNPLQLPSTAPRLTLNFNCNHTQLALSCYWQGLKTISICTLPLQIFFSH